jgi:hypothetical protein
LDIEVCSERLKQLGLSETASVTRTIKEVEMFARRVSLQLKPNSATLLTEKMENEILPMLRKREGFQDEMTFLSQEGTRAFGISLWDRKESAEAYVRETYPQIEKILAPLVEGSPEIRTYNVSNSTFHKVAATVSV